MNINGNLSNSDIRLIIELFERYRLDLDSEWSSDLYDDELELLGKLKILLNEK